MLPTVGLATLIVTAGPWAEAPADPASLAVELSRALGQETAGAPAEAPPRFGDAGSWRWHLHGGWGLDVEDGTDDQEFLLGGGASYFVVDDLSLVGEVNAFYFDQTTNGGVPRSRDGFGFNFNLLLRWHFLVEDRWTLFVDGGGGLLGSTARVPGPEPEEPRGGTYFNFTPQAGAGLTWALDAEVRLVAGVRWHHISNARTSDNNPGRDSLLFYAGLSVPF